MSYSYQNRHMMSAPFRVEVLGMISDTYSMQKNGWEFIADQDQYHYRLGLIAKHHQAQVYADFGYVEINFFQEETFKGFTFHCRRLASKMFIHQNYDMSRWESVDMTPHTMSIQEIELEQFKLFTTPKVRTQEIIVPQETVPELMEKILLLQQPEQERWRKHKLEQAKLDDAEMPQHIFHAQILSIA